MSLNIEQDVKNAGNESYMQMKKMAGNGISLNAVNQFTD